MQIKRSLLVSAFLISAFSQFNLYATSEVVNGELTDGDTRLQDNSCVDFYEVVLEAGQAYVFELTSSQFDTYLALHDGNGDRVAFNDDAEGAGTNSVVYYVPEVSGTYQVWANSLGSDGRGVYELAWGFANAGGEAAQGVFSESFAGELTDGDSRLEDDSCVDVHDFELFAGQSYVFELNAEAFDAYMILHDSEGNRVAFNDDAPGAGTNAAIFFSPETDGTYRIWANSLRVEGRGNYELIWRSVNAGDQALIESSNVIAEQDLNFGETVIGELIDSDERLRDNSCVDFFSFNLTAGQTYVFTMDSQDFDTYIALYDNEGEQVAANDDAPGHGRNSAIAFTPEATGSYRLAANGFSAEDRGEYVFMSRIAGPADMLLVNGSRPLSLPQHPTYRALVIGLDYTWDEGGHLTRCDDDAHYVANTLRSVIPEHKLDLTLLVNDDATVEATQAAMAQLAEETRAGDIVFIFYSGHGANPADSEALSEPDRCRECLCLRDGYLFDIHIQELLNPINIENCGVLMLAIDACFSGGFNEVIDRPGRMALFSSQEYLTSGVPAESDEFARSFGGYLTKALCEALQGEADGVGQQVGKDSLITVQEIEDYIYLNWDNSFSSGQRQLVQMIRPAVDHNTAIVGTPQPVKAGLTDAFFCQDTLIDEDNPYYSADFTAEAGDIYVVETSRLSASCDTIIEIRRSTSVESASPDDPVVVTNDDYIEGNRASRLVWTCEESADYYVAVRAYAGSGGTFHMAVTAADNIAHASGVSILQSTTTNKFEDVDTRAMELSGELYYCHSTSLNVISGLQYTVSLQPQGIQSATMRLAYPGAEEYIISNPALEGQQTELIFYAAQTGQAEIDIFFQTATGAPPADDGSFAIEVTPSLP